MNTRISATIFLALALVLTVIQSSKAVDNREQIAFFEKKIRPLLAERCYRCHSESAKKQRGGLLLDRESGWLKGGDTGKAVVPGEPDASLLIQAIRYKDENLQMPPGKPLAEKEVRLLEAWVKSGAVGPGKVIGETAFSRLGDQKYLFAKAKEHWAFQPVATVKPPDVAVSSWNQHPIDQFVFTELAKRKLTPSERADPRTLIRRLSYDLTGLPPTPEAARKFVKEHRQNPTAAIEKAVDRMLASSAFGEHLGRIWLDVARYADTDSFYRPDTRTPHYFPFAFTYRDYVIKSFNSDKPYDRFLQEQLAADLLGGDAPLAALGFLGVAPHANRSQAEALDDWIDVTTRGLLGVTAACARCHDHKYEPIPTEDYYSLRGIFASMNRVHPLDEKNLPIVPGYEADKKDQADYQKKRSVIETKIKKAGGGRKRGSKQAIRETELAQLLLFHPAAPARAMIVRERRKPAEPVVFVRGDPGNRGSRVPRRFLKILDPHQQPFPEDSSGRLELAEKIASADNPLTARVFVNRVWGFLVGSYLVDTPSDFGLQGSPPTHPQLLDWLASDFMAHDWSVKRLVRNIVLSRTYQQSSAHRAEMAAIDPDNKFLWRANRKRLSIESLRDSLLAVAGKLDGIPFGHPGKLWGEDYSHRRTIYGYINRFNLDPTLRTFDFPSPMATHAGRPETIVPTQALFTLNSRFVIDKAEALTETKRFKSRKSDSERVAALFQAVFQRTPREAEVRRIAKFVQTQESQLQNSKSRIRSPWPLVAQALLMSNEFQYVD